MSGRPTPETDNLARGNHVVPTEFAKDLERELNESRDEAEHWKIEWEIVEARLCGWKHPRDNGIIFEHEIIPKLQRERDEARKEAEYYKERYEQLKDGREMSDRKWYNEREIPADEETK